MLNDRLFQRLFKFFFLKAACFTMIFLLGFILPFQNVYAVYDVHDFNGDELLEQRYRNLIDEIRCPKCQNQNVAGSNAPIAKDIREKVFSLLLQDKSNEEILSYVVERYGDFAWYRPPVNRKTWLLWFIPPVIFLLVVSCWGIGAFRKKKLGKKGENISSLSALEIQRIEEINLDLDEESPPKNEK